MVTESAVNKILGKGGATPESILHKLVGHKGKKHMKHKRYREEEEEEDDDYED